MALFLFVPALLLVLGSCAPDLNPFISRSAYADKIAAGWEKQVFRTERFDLAGYARITKPADAVLAVFIEGDGLSYISRTEISSDPTPERPTALEMAVRHPAPNVLYLARPCQYAEGPRRRGCEPLYWTTGRFAPEAVAALNRAIDQIVAMHAFRSVMLYGYSGGGAMAALVAARRKDVSGLVTVAGVLDHQAWTSHFGDSPLRYSLNPADDAELLRGIAQRHFVGERDKTVPLLVAQSYLRRARLSTSTLTIVPRADHTCCWADLWPELARMMPAAHPNSLQ
ncbi:alpha/beta hydrolase [Ferrovibrio terrae]|uniref:alpha/beta hydrolase family protein n=1 Tax=Ferrovibrio terrae TaxID=2594003 RepID=UPI0031377643